MKNKLLFGVLACVLLALVGFAFKPSGSISLEKAGLVSSDNVAYQVQEANGVRTFFKDGSEYFADNGKTFYEYTWTKDTITNAANDTLTIPSTQAIAQMYSDFEYSYTITRTNISGTTALALKIEQNDYPIGSSNAAASGAWVTLASGAATTATAEKLAGDCTTMRLRYIVDGSGTQSSSYTLRAIFKKKT